MSHFAQIVDCECSHLFTCHTHKDDDDDDKPQVLWPKESAEFIMGKAKDVSIDKEGIQLTADKIYEAWSHGQLSLKRFKECEVHPSEANETAINWIFLADTLNFSFWSGDPVTTTQSNDHNSKKVPVPKWEVEYKGKVHTGYFALCAGINRAIDEGLDILNPTVFGSLTEADILRIFRSATSTPIPMVSERVKNLKDAASVLIEKYNGSFVNCVKEAGGSAKALLNSIVTNFSSYRDDALFWGKRVSFWKRAQILVGDIWVCFEGQGLGAFDDIDETLTMFADYRIPQVLYGFGALKYSKELLQVLEKDQLIPNADRLEIEIRGGSIHAVELIKAQLHAKASAEPNEAVKQVLGKTPINSVMIDHWLWDYRREHLEETDKYPYHKTRCIYY